MNLPGPCGEPSEEMPIGPACGLPARADADIADLEARASEAASVLRLLANDRRLVILCHLAAEREATVGRLIDLLGAAQSAVSQHLARLRMDGLVATRRAGTTIHYRLADPRIARILAVLRETFCAPAR